MNTTNQSTKDSLNKKLTITKTSLTLALLLTLTQGCSSVNRHQEKMKHVLEVQDELIDQVQIERNSKGLLEKLQADKDIDEAEVRLKEALEALKESNAALKEAISKQ